MPQVPNSAAKRSAANGGLMNTGAGTMNSNISSFGGNFNPSSCSEFKFSNQSGAPVPQPTDVPQQAAVPDQVSSSSKQEVHAAEVDLSAAAPNPPPAAAVPAPALFAPAIPGAAPPLAAVGIPGAAPPLGALSLPGAPIPPPLMKAVAPPPLLSGPKVLAYKSGRPVVVTNGPMRQLHWVPVPLDKIKDTCWQKDITDEKIDMDVDEFDYLFQRP